MNRKILISTLNLCLLLCSAGLARAQSWAEVNDPFATRKVFMAGAHQGNLWILDDGNAFSGGKGESLRLKSWDNNSWKAYPEYSMSGMDSIHGGAFIGLDTSMYVVCYTWFAGTQNAILLRFDIPSQNWREIGSFEVKVGSGSIVNSIVLYNKAIYIAGKLFDSQGQNQIIRILPVFEFAEQVALVDGEILDMGVYQGSLYIGGKFVSIDGNPIQNLALYSNNQFTSYSGTTGTTEYLKRLEHGELVFLDAQNGQKKYLNYLSPLGDQTLNLDFPSDLKIHDFASEGGEYFAIQNSTYDLYPAGVYHLDNSRKTWVPMQSKLDVMNSVFVNTGNKLYLVELGESSYHIEQKSLVYFSAQVFVDKDGDCAYSSGDVIFEKDLMLEDVKSEHFWRINGQDGWVEGYTQGGSYSFKVPNLPVSLSDQKCQVNQNLQWLDKDSNHIEIPLSIVDQTPAIKLSVSAAQGFRARQGFEESYFLDIYNQGDVNNTCDILLKIPDEIQFTRADIMPFDSSNGTYRWKLDLNPYAKKRIRFYGTVDVNTPSYTHIRLDAWSDKNCMKVDNTDTLGLEVRGAFDPNDKQNAPESYINKNTKEIFYHIRFQNTGSDTAYRVKVIDTLDLNLDLANFQLVKYSHPTKFHLDIIGTTQLFTFDQIMLPDSSEDFDGSQGYITYKAKLRSNLNNGDTVVNRAYIYFDYQKPVETNPVVNTMRDEEDKLPEPISGMDTRYLVYPNPSQGQFRVVNFTRYPTNAMLYDAQGKLLGQFHLNADSETNLNVQGLSQGIYFLRFPDWNTQESIVINK
ncbi:MAG: T9SS type A sorting domain-containing protein [Bacteroidetes bacterium]|nr:T9SS type A sorting domain-containing protein [Bacteroidota bacterium]